MDVAARDVEAHVALLNEHQYNHDDSDGTTCSSDDEFEYGLEPPVTAADRPIGDLDLERGDGDDVQVKEAVSDIDGETSAAREEEHRHRDAAASETEDEYHFEKTVQVGRFGRFRKDDMRLLRRKTGAAAIQPLGLRDEFKRRRSLGSVIRNANGLNGLGRLPKESVMKISSASKVLNNHYFPPPKEEMGKRKPRTKPWRFRSVLFDVVEDWVLLALLGIIMAICSLSMDVTIDHLQSWHWSIIEYTDHKFNGLANICLTFIVWVFYAVILVSASALFSHYVAQQAIGSGIPEMKTILRGVILKEYLTLRTLISKMVGLTLSLGSGMPIGKEGPFVHVASVVANLLSHMSHSIHGIYANESRSSEMLAAGCAVGVACTFSAPVGGVLFSIEVTSVYFAVRNYWRGFFAAACSATLFRLLRVVFTDTEVTVVAFYQTNFPREAFFPEEMPFFALIGLICGLLSALFIFLQRNMVLFLRRNSCAKRIFQKYWLIYPIVVSFVVATLTYPKGYGQFLAGEKKFSATAKDFFKNCTWTAVNGSGLFCGEEFLTTWTGPYGDFSIFTTLSCFIVTYFLLAALSSTLPVPSGIFGPTFTLGAAIGRIVGELIAAWYPEGLRGPDDLQIYPGVYAVVGAAAFCGGVTHTVSVAVIIFELTGQLLYILPVMIAVLIANAVCSYLQPSIYDSIIKIKHLPYLPDIPHSSSNFHGIRVEQFMTRSVRFLSKASTYQDVQDMLLDHPRLKAFPVVEDTTTMILIGSCSRSKLLRSLEARVGQEARQVEANQRIKTAIEDADRRFKMVDKQRADLRLDGRRPSIPSFHVDKPQEEKPPEQELESRLVAERHAKSVDETNGNLSNGRTNGSSGKDDLEATGRPRLHSATGRFTIVPVSINASLSTNTEPHTEKETGSGQSSPKAKSGHSDGGHDVYHTIGDMLRSVTHFSMGRFGRKHSHSNDYDLAGDERKAWELERLSGRIDLDAIGVDPAPFQLVEHSSLFKIHSLFSLLGLNRAYVTKCGRLVGVVALRDLRIAVEKVQMGQLSSTSPPLYSDLDPTTAADPSKAPKFFAELSKDEEDLRNDVLNPPLEVISRVNTARELDEEHLTAASKPAENSSLPRRRALSVSSDPCLARVVDQEPSAKGERRCVSMDQSNIVPKKSGDNHPEGKLMTIEDEDAILPEFVCGGEDNAPSRARDASPEVEADSSGEDTGVETAPAMLRSRSEPFTAQRSSMRRKLSNSASSASLQRKKSRHVKIVIPAAVSNGEEELGGQSQSSL
ncbi:Protein CLH-4 a [Aphelenchoides avenae]|nr:Protein CLH-4 a [Aphelenchus avenae]